MFFSSSFREYSFMTLFSGLDAVVDMDIIPLCHPEFLTLNLVASL